MTISELYEKKRTSDPYKDIAIRMPDLVRHARNCKTVVEFGVRTGNSTVSFLHGGCEVWSYDIEKPEFIPTDDIASKWHFTLADTRTLPDIPECDILFIDSEHIEDQVRAELKMAHRCKRYLIFHDIIQSFAHDANRRGIGFPILDFMWEHKQWKILELLFDPQGLLVLEKTPQ